MADSKKPTKRQIAAAFAQAKIESMGDSIPEAPRAEELAIKGKLEVIRDLADSCPGHFWEETVSMIKDEAQQALAALASQPAGESEATTAEQKLQKAGVFKGIEGLRKFSEADSFWESHMHGTRFYFGSGISDYLHRDVLRSAVKLLDSQSQPEIPDVDALALHIRKVGSIGASALAESICNWIAEGGQ